MFVYFPGIEILETEHDLRRGKKSLVAVLCSCVYVCFRPPQTSRLGFSCCSRAVTAKGACCTCKVVVLLIKPFAFRGRRC